MSGEPDGERVIAGRYRLLSPLGEGGMGTVWRARDEVLHREVAVKEVRAPTGLPRADVGRMYVRLEREAWVKVSVTGSRTHYSGDCPAPHDRAPCSRRRSRWGGCPRRSAAVRVGTPWW